jgi:hypothetical protein
MCKLQFIVPVIGIIAASRHVLEQIESISGGGRCKSKELVLVGERGRYPRSIGYLFHCHSRMLESGIQSGFAIRVLRQAAKMVCH